MVKVQLQLTETEYLRKIFQEGPESKFKSEDKESPGDYNKYVNDVFAGNMRPEDLSMFCEKLREKNQNGLCG